MDQKLFLIINSLSGQTIWLDKLIYFCAVYLPWITVAFLIILILSKRKWLEIFKGLFIFFSAGLAWFLAGLFKYIYFSPRPFMELFVNKPLFTMEVWWDSFPSGHAVFFAALAGSAFGLKQKKWGLYLSTMAIIIALARVAAGVHWPSDVVVGLLFGGAVGFLLGHFFKRVFPKKDN
ncbi:MAG: phosphatase PAP2 family protein [Candidatus Paceibacterota bacterium]